MKSLHFHATVWAQAGLAMLLSAALLGCSSPKPPPMPPAAKVEPAPPPPPYVGPVLQLEQTDRGVQIVLPSVVLFDVNKASFNLAVAGPYLDRVAGLLNSKTTKSMLVEGHTDSDGSTALNAELSKARAAAVADALQSRGVSASRLSNKAYGAGRPVASNATEDGKRLNRRVEIIVLDERVENLTAGEPAASFESAWANLKSLIDRGLVKAVPGIKS